MIKKIIFSLIVFSTLFITKDVFALTSYSPYKTDTSVYDSKDYWYFKSFSSSTTTDFNYMVAYDIDSNSATYGFALMSDYLVKDNYSSLDDAKEYNFNEDVRFKVSDLNNTWWDDYGDKLGLFMCNARFVSGQGILCYDENLGVEGSESLSTMLNSNVYYLEVNIVDNMPEYDAPLPPSSDISDILLPDNTTSLDDIIEPISAPAGLNVYFTNYEINPYAYLHINLITCTNGINEGCNGFNETERFFSIPISYLGYSEDEDDLLLYKFNLQGLVTQNDYISVSYQLSNCDYSISVCPEGNSSGRSYQFLVNNALTEGTWVDFEDEARPECTFARLDVCFINAMNWLFLPSPKLLSDITSITFSDRIPFSYIYDLDNLYEEAFNDTPKDINIAIAFGSFGNITLLSTDKLEAIPFQGMVRTILGAIMIFGAVMYVYKKVLTINDRREVTEKQ